MYSTTRWQVSKTSGGWFSVLFSIRLGWGGRITVHRDTILLQSSPVWTTSPSEEDNSGHVWQCSDLAAWLHLILPPLSASSHSPLWLRSSVWRRVLLTSPESRVWSKKIVDSSSSQNISSSSTFILYSEVQHCPGWYQDSQMTKCWKILPVHLPPVLHDQLELPPLHFW